VALLLTGAKRQGEPLREGADRPAGHYASALPQTVPTSLKIKGMGDTASVSAQLTDVKAETTGNIASTRCIFVFKNKTRSVMEGELAFSLPGGRVVTHFALDINGRMREGVPVEKGRGALAYEEITRPRTGVDPGLLEMTGDNNYRARVYPIPVNGTRTISIGYEEALPAPDGVPSVSIRRTRDSCYFLAAVAPNLDPRKKNWGDELAIIWDVSLSGLQRDLRREAEMLDIIFAEKKNVTAHLYYLSNKLKKSISKSANTEIAGSNNGGYKVIDGNCDELRDTLNAAVFDGGTDYSRIDLDNIAGSEILFFSDGISTLSDSGFLKKAGASRPIHCVVSSASADLRTMKSIADKTKGKYIDANALSPEIIKYELLNETPRFLGAEHGKKVRGVYPGIPTPVYGGFSIAGVSDTADTELTMLFGYGGKVEKRVKVALDAKSADTVGNADKFWAQKKIAELDLDDDKNHARIAEVGQQHGIVAQYSSLIVLETRRDYVRYGIAPPAELLAEHRYAAMLEEFIGARENDIGARHNGNANEICSDRAWPLILSLEAAMNNFIDDVNRAPKGEAELRDEYRRIVKLTEFFDSGAFGAAAFEQLLITGAFRTPKSEAELRDEYRRIAKLEEFCRADTGAKYVAFRQLVIADTFGTPKSDAELRDEYRRAARLENEAADLISTGVASDWEYLERILGICIRENKEVRPVIKAIALEERRAMLKQMTTLERICYFWRSTYRRPEYFPAYFKKLPEERTAKLVRAEEIAAPTGQPVTAANRPAITIMPVKKDSACLNELTGELAKDYRLYLKLREGYADWPEFYFGMAERFYALGDKETALRVLTSIAELGFERFENATLYRQLGYRFKEYGEYALEKYVCEKVIRWRPNAQSYRDYALALADNGEAQAALDSLYSLLKRYFVDNYSGGMNEVVERFIKPDSSNIGRQLNWFGEVVVTEINRMIAKNANLNTSKIDKRLIASSPADIRVVINWDFSGADIDLHVTDPNDEGCYSGHRKTKIGGRVSEDVQNGYGPEQFTLKNAIKGKYRVSVNYYASGGNHAGYPVTVMAEVFTDYAGKDERRRVVCLPLLKAKEARSKYEESLVKVAEFEF
jgi:hypothetical protein